MGQALLVPIIIIIIIGMKSGHVVKIVISRLSLAEFGDTLIVRNSDPPTQSLPYHPGALPSPTPLGKSPHFPRW